MPSAKFVPEIVNRIREVLDEVHHAAGRDQVQSTISKARAEIEGLPEELRIPVLQKALGKGIRRWRAAASVLGRCTQGSHIDNWIATALKDSDREHRDWMIQIVGNQRLVRFAPEINRIIRDDLDCREFAITAAGDLGTDANCATLVSYADSLGPREIPMNLLQALSKFKSDKVKPFLQRAFETGSDDHYRVFAAWGLGRQGDRKAIEYLVSMLDDADEYPSLPARRAAQALSDLFDWSLEWTLNAPVQAKKRWHDMTQQ